MSDQVICTIIAKNYLAQARCLVSSFLTHHPEGRAFVLLIDDLDGYYDPDQESFTTVPVEAIGIPDLPAMTLRYTLLEFSTAVKPFFLEYLFHHYGFDKICYFDPDIYFYAPINEIWDLLDSYGIVLTPHLVGFLDDEYRPTELDILRVGTFNLGFIGLSRHPELAPLLSWWQSKLLRRCIVSVEEGLFVDQRWMDLAPSLFSSVCIYRNPACNVAYWNLSHRTLVRDEQGRYTVNGRPLEFFHFSGFYPDRQDVPSIHQTRFTFRNSPYLKPLFSAYHDCLVAHGYETIRQWPYSHNYHGDIRIPDIAHTLWRKLESSDPSGELFRTTPEGELTSKMLAWLNKEVDKTPPGQPPITQLALGLYQSRPDLQQVFPDVLGRDRRQFAHWFVTRGKIEYDLDDIFVQLPVERRTPSLPEIGELSGRQLSIRFYYLVTNLLFRIGVGSYLERKLGERQVSRVRHLFVRPDRNRLVVPTPEPTLATLQEKDAQQSQGALQ